MDEFRRRRRHRRQRQRLRWAQMLDYFGIEIGTSFGHLAGKIWRIGTMGHVCRKIRFGDNAATISAFVAKQVDVLVTGNTVAAKVTKGNPNLKTETKFIVRQSPAFIGIRAGEMNMLKWVNVFVLHKKLGGKLDALSRKWLGQKLPPLPSL